MELQLLESVLEGVFAGVVYGLSGYLKSRAADGAGLRPGGVLSAALWGALVGLAGWALGVDLESAEKMLFDIGALVIVKKLSEAAWHSPPVRRVWAR